MEIAQVVIMPTFFASKATYPVVITPPRANAIVRANSPAYAVDALRAWMILNGASVSGLVTDYVVLIVVFAVLVAIAARVYGRMGS